MSPLEVLLNAIIILTGLTKTDTCNEIHEFDRLAKLDMDDTRHEV